MSQIEGGCLCGAVRYSVAEQSGGGHCYCTDCRKSSGSSHCSHMMVPGEAFSLQGELRYYDKATDAGNTVSRGFCGVCGSAVVSTNTGMPGLFFVRASSLDDPNDFTPRMVVYTSRAPTWASIDGALPTFAEMPAP